MRAGRDLAPSVLVVLRVGFEHPPTVLPFSADGQNLPTVLIDLFKKACEIKMTIRTLFGQDKAVRWHCFALWPLTGCSGM